MKKSKVNNVIKQFCEDTGAQLTQANSKESPVQDSNRYSEYGLGNNHNESGFDVSNKSRSKIYDTEQKIKTAAKQASSLLQTKLNNARANGKSKIENSHLNNALEHEIKVSTKDYRLPKSDSKQTGTKTNKVSIFTTGMLNKKLSKRHS